MFAESAIWKKIILFLFCILFCAFICTVTGTLIIKLGGLDPTATASLKILQLLGSTGIFILAPLCTIYLTEREPLKFLKIELADPRIVGLGLLALFLFAPCVSQIGWLNEQMSLPDFLKPVEDWMREEENKAKVLTLRFLEVNRIPELLENLFVIALIPAIGEELMFRGYIQQSLAKNLKNPHIAVWVAAFLFSAIHLQFFGFFPRLLLGALLGYLFLYGKSIIINIFGHFMNNAVIIIYAFVNNPEEALKNDMPESDIKTAVIVSILSLMMTAGVILLIKKKATTWKGKLSA